MKKLVKSYLNKSQTLIGNNKQSEEVNSENNKNFKKITDTKEVGNYLKIQSAEQTQFEYDSFEDAIEQFKGKNKYRCLIRVNGNLRIRWDLFVLILSIWNCYTLPLDVAFQPQTFNESAFRIFNNLIDCCFGIDILLNFRTTFISRQTGDEIVSSKKIAMDYIKHKFWIDLAATVPFD